MSIFSSTQILSQNKSPTFDLKRVAQMKLHLFYLQIRGLREICIENTFIALRLYIWHFRCHIFSYDSIGQSEVNLIVSGAVGVASDFLLHMEISWVKLPNLLTMTSHLHVDRSRCIFSIFHTADMRKRFNSNLHQWAINTQIHKETVSMFSIIDDQDPDLNIARLIVS